MYLINVPLTLERVALKLELGVGVSYRPILWSWKGEGTVLQAQMRIQEAEPLVISPWLSGNTAQWGDWKYALSLESKTSQPTLVLLHRVFLVRCSFQLQLVTLFFLGGLSERSIGHTLLWYVNLQSWEAMLPQTRSTPLSRIYTFRLMKQWGCGTLRHGTFVE